MLLLVPGRLLSKDPTTAAFGPHVPFRLWECFFPFETGYHCVVGANLELRIPLPQPPKCWHDKPPCPALLPSDVSASLLSALVGSEFPFISEGGLNDTAPGGRK